MCEKVVLVTGFGPFREHKVNASWEAVKLLPEQIDGVKIVKEEIPVLYTVVDEKVPQLWKKYNPILVVHVGVSRFATSITLETFASRLGYQQSDCGGNKHCTGSVCEDGENTLSTSIDVKEICNYLNGTTNIRACVSTNAGRYLCEYTFYKSLYIDSTKRVLFVHVPVLNQPYSAEELSKGIGFVIEKALEQL